MIVPVYSCLIVFMAVYLKDSLAIRCYQCSSDMDPKGVDSCGAYKSFNRTDHTPVECNSDESHMPGSFCAKTVQQGPRGFIWDGRWRQVIRRCASVAETGVTGVCNWGVYENGVYWEECYCSSDSCNGAISQHRPLSVLYPILQILAVIMFGHRICWRT